MPGRKTVTRWVEAERIPGCNPPWKPTLCAGVASVREQLVIAYDQCSLHFVVMVAFLGLKVAAVIQKCCRHPR